MDLFKKTQILEIGHGGIRCSCCNDLARIRRGKIEKKFNRRARRRIKNLTRKEILKIT